MLLAMPNLLLANGSGVWQSNALQTIIDFTSGPFMKAIGAIIVICVGIYVVKNLDRLGEIAWKCIGIILATIAIANAQTIATKLFGVGRMILNYVETINVREISKKEKFLKLNMNSWIISFLSASFLFVWSLLYGVVLLVALITMFYILEFFDKDITNIILANLTLKNDTKEYYA